MPPILGVWSANWKRASGRSMGDLLEADFWTTSRYLAEITDAI
jgi:hypothetical protein